MDGGNLREPSGLGFSHVCIQNLNQTFQRRLRDLQPCQRLQLVNKDRKRDFSLKLHSSTDSCWDHQVVHE